MLSNNKSTKIIRDLMFLEETSFGDIDEISLAEALDEPDPMGLKFWGEKNHERLIKMASYSMKNYTDDNADSINKQFVNNVRNSGISDPKVLDKIHKFLIKHGQRAYEALSAIPPKKWGPLIVLGLAVTGTIFTARYAYNKLKSYFGR